MQYSRENPTVPPVLRWFHLTPELFDRWNSEYNANEADLQQLFPTAPAPVPSTQTQSSTQKQLESYTRSIKRDESSYKTFKEERFWLGFRRSLLITAKAQNVERIFDLDFDRSSLI